MHSIPQMTLDERPIEIPDLSTLLDVATALSRCDDLKLDELVRECRHPERVYEHACRSAPFTAHTVKGSANCEHSALWVAPVVTRAGASLATNMPPSAEGSQGIHLGDWVRQWFGMLDYARCFDYLPGYSSIVSMTPGNIRNMLEALVKRRPSKAPNFEINRSELEAQVTAGLPDLAFMVGSVSRLNDLPLIHMPGRMEDAVLIQRIESALSVWGGHARPQLGDFRIGIPTPFSEGLVSGLCMWVSAVSADFDTMVWDAMPVGSGCVSLRWVVRNRWTGTEVTIVKGMQLAQIGEDGVRTVLSCVGSVASSAEKPRTDSTLLS